MKHVKYIALLLALVLCLGLLTACGGENPEETSPTATLPTMAAPDGSGYAAPDSTAPVRDSKAGLEGDPFSETKPWQPDDKTTDGETGNAPTDPAATQPSPTAPAPTSPAPTTPASTAPDPSASVGDDSDEDLG